MHRLQEIVDETDRYIDNMRVQRVNAALLTSNLPRHLRKYADKTPCMPLSLPCSLGMPASPSPARKAHHIRVAEGPPVTFP